MLLVQGVHHGGLQLFAQQRVFWQFVHQHLGIAGTACGQEDGNGIGQQRRGVGAGDQPFGGQTGERLQKGRAFG